MLNLPGLDHYITRPDYAAEDRAASMEKAGEYIDELSAQEIAEEVFYDDAVKARQFLARHGSKLLIEQHPHLNWLVWFYEGDEIIWWLMWSDEDCLRFLQEDCCKDLLLEHFGERLAEQTIEAWNEPPERDPWN